MCGPENKGIETENTAMFNPQDNVVDERGRIEQLLVMSGVEQNPGPFTKDGREIHTALTHDILTWVFDAAIWGSSTSDFSDRVRALLRHFRPGSMPHRWIIQLASELRDAQGGNINDETRWMGLVTAVRELLPNSALSQ